MSIDCIYTKDILNLFILPFDKLEINIKKNNNENSYNWNNFKNIFNKLYDNIIFSIDNNDLNTG